MRDPALYEGTLSEPSLFDPSPSEPGPSENSTTRAEPTFRAPVDPVPDIPGSPVPTAPVLLATDGSCLRNPGGATGWAYVRSDGRWAYGGCPAGTNQVGELMAVVLALTDHPDVEVEIQCDSAYAIGSATTWKKGWQRNNYVNSQRKTVANLAIIQQLHALIDARTASLIFTKVKGHDPSNRWPLNTAVDVVCGLAAQAALESGGVVRDSGVMEIDWEPSRSRRAGTE